MVEPEPSALCPTFHPRLCPRGVINPGLWGAVASLGSLCSGPARSNPDRTLPPPNPRKGRERYPYRPPEAEQSIGGCCRHHGCLWVPATASCWPHEKARARAGGGGGVGGRRACCPWGVLLGSSCHVLTLPSRGSWLKQDYPATAGCVYWTWPGGLLNPCLTTGMPPSWSFCSLGSSIYLPRKDRILHTQFLKSLLIAP